MAKKNRIKLTQPVLRSRVDVESTLNEITLTTINRNRAQLDMDKAITAARERYEATIATCNQAIEEKSELVRTWAEQNPAEFGKVKSIDFVHAVIGFRTGTPTLKPMRGWTWDRVLEKMKGSAFWSAWIRTKEEVNKQTLLIDRDSLADHLPDIGLQVKQDESFYIEPKLTDQDNKIDLDSRSERSIRGNKLETGSGSQSKAA
jgi:phage host-nuclease inhibitor protein Gam